MSADVGKSDSTDRGEPETFHTAGANIGQSRLTRRSFLRAATVGGTAAGLGTTAATGETPLLSPVGNAQAIPPVAIGAAAVGGSAAVGWALREYEVVGSDDPPEGMTPEALHNRVYDASRARESNNWSTFIDNRTILDGVEHTAHADGKIAAIEALNDEQSESEVKDAALEKVDEYITTVQENLLKSWEETYNEFVNLWDSVEKHNDLNVEDVFRRGYAPYEDAFDESKFSYDSFINPPKTTDSYEYELVNGSTFEISEADIDGGRYVSAGRPLNWHDDNSYFITISHPTDSGTYAMILHGGAFHQLLKEMETIAGNVRDGLITWVESVYGEVQSGEMDTADLLTPRELAEMTADEEDFNQAISDLMALNVSVELEREAEVHIPELDATIYGQIATTGSGPLSTGTINPENESDDYYLTYDVSEGSGNWGAYETGVDGGTVTFTSEPWEETVYYVHTVAGETAEILASDFEHDEEEDEWTYDVSNQLDDATTNIEDVEYFATTEETQYETVQLTDTFEIITFRDSDGEEHDEANFTQTEPHTDDNYITQEEWEEQQERHEELIEKYEDAQGGGGGIDLGGGGFLSGLGPDLWLRDDSLISGVPNWVPIAGGGAVAYLFGGD